MDGQGNTDGMQKDDVRSFLKAVELTCYVFVIRHHLHEKIFRRNDNLSKYRMLFV